MQNYIVAGLPDQLGVFRGRIEFGPRLNIISGENGTMKTRLLQALRNGQFERSQPNADVRIQAISPKRNSERRAVEAILQTFRQQNRTWEATLNERAGGQINDATYDNYPSLGDLFYLLFEHRCKDGGDRTAHMTDLVKDLNRVIEAVFPHYKLTAAWDPVLGAPRIGMSKNGNIEFPIEALSLGEQEILSLITNINESRDRIDVFLIDEPEVHLNWHLEERLFAFLAKFCTDNDKQIILVTHSRVIFKPDFLPFTQFLSWSEDGRIQWTKDLTRAQRDRIAGDAIEVIALGEVGDRRVFVEDGAHALAVSALAAALGTEVRVSKCGNSANVKSLFIHQKSTGRWDKTLFVIDGDNMGNPFPGDNQFVHLPYYCIENAFINSEILALTLHIGVDEVQQSLLNSLIAKKDKVFAKNKFFEFLASNIKASDMTYDRLALFDASLIFDDLLDRLSTNRETLVPKYLDEAKRAGKLETLFPASLIEFLRADSSA